MQNASTISSWDFNANAFNNGEVAELSSLISSTFHIPPLFQILLTVTVFSILAYVVWLFAVFTDFWIVVVVDTEFEHKVWPDFVQILLEKI